MTRRRARHMRRVGEHMPCRTRRCMRHGISNANGHGMPCDEGFPISAASKDTVGRIPPTCQHLMLRVSSGEGSSLFCTLLFPKILDRSKLLGFFLLGGQLLRPENQPTSSRLGSSNLWVTFLDFKPTRFKKRSINVPKTVRIWVRRWHGGRSHARYR